MSSAADTKRRVLWLTRGAGQASLVKVWWKATRPSATVLDGAVHAHARTVGRRDRADLVGGPGLPFAQQRVAGLEHEAAAGRERGADGGEGGGDLAIRHEHLEGVTGHHDQVERRGEARGGEVAEGPVDRGIAARHRQHPGGGIEPARRPPCPATRALISSSPVPQPTSSTDGAAITSGR